MSLAAKPKRIRMGAGLLCVLLGSLLLGGCGVLAGADSVATVEADLTRVGGESAAIQQTAQAEKAMALETLVAAGTRVAGLSAVNAALGATLRANYTPTPALQAVVVSADDMGSSLDLSALADEPASFPVETEMRVSGLSTARETDPDSGCSRATVTQFSTSDERIYATARVSALQAGASFEIEWVFQDRVVSSYAWTARYSKDFECLWFYVTPADFPFAPGLYRAALVVNGSSVGAVQFTISAA